MLKHYNKSNITVGTTLFVVPCSLSSHDRPHTITIKKVGRKYAYFGVRDERIDLETLTVEPDYRGVQPTLWDSEADYLAEMEKLKVIQRCREAFTSHDRTKRKILTYEKAVKILAILDE